MNGTTKYSLKQFWAVFCVALVLGFSGMNMADVVDRIQHQNEGVSSHEHILLSKISIVAIDHQADKIEADFPYNTSYPDQHPGSGHHHHSDGNAGFPAFISGEVAAIHEGKGANSHAPHFVIPDFMLNGPERPPKEFAINV